MFYLQKIYITIVVEENNFIVKKKKFAIVIKVTNI